jgi:hypothetical protein
MYTHPMRSCKTRFKDMGTLVVAAAASRCTDGTVCSVRGGVRGQSLNWPCAWIAPELIHWPRRQSCFPAGSATQVSADKAFFHHSGSQQTKCAAARRCFLLRGDSWSPEAWSSTDLIMVSSQRVQGIKIPNVQGTCLPFIKFTLHIACCLKIWKMKSKVMCFHCFNTVVRRKKITYMCLLHMCEEKEIRSIWVLHFCKNTVWSGRILLGLVGWQHNICMWFYFLVWLCTHAR